MCNQIDTYVGELIDGSTALPQVAEPMRIQHIVGSGKVDLPGRGRSNYSFGGLRLGPTAKYGQSKYHMGLYENGFVKVSQL